MNILYWSYKNPHFETITEYMERALIRAGHTVYFESDRDYLIPGRIRDAVPFLERWDLGRMNKKVMDRTREYDIDFCLVGGGHRVLSRSLAELNARGVKCGLWTIDPPREFEIPYRVAPMYSFVCCGGSEAVHLLAGRGISSLLLPFACDPNVHHPVDVSEQDLEKYERDAVFVGSYYPNRLEMFEALEGVESLGIWGPGWDNMPQDCPLQDVAVDCQLVPAEWIKIISCAKIVIIAHYQDGSTPCYQASPKVYESLACGGFVLVDDQRDVFDLFEDGVHLVRYRDAVDLREKVEYFLERPEERQRIAEAGRQKAISEHSFDQRVVELMEMADNG